MAGVAVRAVGLLLLCAVVVGCAVWGADRWGDAARRQVVAEQLDAARAPTPEGGDAEFPRGAKGVAERLPGSGSSGSIAVRIYRGGADKDWHITSRYRLSLRAKDPLVARLRAEPSLIAEVSYVWPGGHATARPVAYLDQPSDPAEESANLRGLPAWCTVSQPSQGGRVTITATQDVTVGAFAAGTPLDYDIALRVSDDDGGIVPRLPGHWTWSLDAPSQWGLKVKGHPQRQTPHAVRFALTEKRGAASVTAEFVASTEQGRSAADSQNTALASGEQALISLLALFLTTGATLLGFVRAPSDPVGLRRRTRATALGACALLATAAGVLLWDLYQPNWSVLGWMWQAFWFSVGDLASRTLPIEACVQGALLGIMLFASPVLVTAATYRVRGSPPPPGAVLAVAAPAPALVLAAWGMGGLDWTRPVVICLTCASLAAGVVLGYLSLPFGVRNIHTWAVPLSAATWAGVAPAIVLQFIPRSLWEQSPGEPFTFTHLTLEASWLAVFLLLTPWVTALLLLAGPPFPSGVLRRSVLGTVLIVALLPWWTPLREATSSELPPASYLLLGLAGQSPGDQYILGIRILAPTLQVIWVTAAVLLMSHLYNCGREPRHWHRTARASCVALIVLATSATVIGAPDSWLPYWTTAAALFASWTGGLLLLPAGRTQRAARLHALSGGAHARIVASLARSLLFAEGRHRFLTSSRATLADTSLPADTWEDKWRSLREPTAADAVRASARLRAAALGGSAGRSAWSNGRAAAAATALLTLPWTVWTAWPAHGYSGVPEAVTVAGGATCVWLAHGFTYGYLYPWLRGNSPVVKAGWLGLVMSTVQLLLLVPHLQVPLHPAGLSVFLLLAQSAVLALGLALYWEIRLVHRGDLLWGHIRNFRRLSSLATPVSAVLVAAIAAAVTVLATAWADNVTAPVESPSPSSSSSSPP
jgi:hypothetical protein